MDREIEHIVDIIWQNKNIQDNASDIEGLKKIIDNLTKRIEQLEKN
ncbi:hypothetical protein LCGC14_1007570 [marine sediment metagenome]|uniref:Uncharacterized protein n=1 Tax=marine sediment metagenome TaxID=412755 RepID=A0A0F9N5X4_9ZZZZ